MENILSTFLPEIIFGSSDKSISNKISKLEKKGQIRKIAPRIYSSNLTETPETIIKRNLFQILSSLYPGSILSHRSAFEFQLTDAGHIFLTYKYTKSVTLPGITIRFLQGPKPINGDNPFFEKLYCSQKPRAFLENLQGSKRPGPTSKTLSLPVIEEKLEQIIRVHGEEGLNKIRDEAKKIAPHLNMKSEFEKLDKLIGALLTTHPSKSLKSPVAIARAFGAPYDTTRIPLFENLFVELMKSEFKDLPELNTTEKSFRNFAFYESYFSNYIEGTEFELEEAKQIITTGIPMSARDEDSHDILGTYNLVSNREKLKIQPSTAEELLQLLREMHGILLSSRVNKRPGEFKDKNNRAGETHFVDFNLVRGTLIKGYDFYRSLSHPFAKAAFIMFLISEVHPFLDGNGRIARLMMNSELVKANKSKIIIPTVYREDYLGALRKLTRQKSIKPYIRMLQRAHEFSSTVFDDDIETMEKYLTECNAFKEPSEAKLLFNNH